MRVLFVSSGNSRSFDIAPFIKTQGEDLIDLGVDVDFFPIKGRGIKGYIRNIPRLRKTIKNGNYDLIHAHFVLSAWVALLAFSGKKVIASFMGSDTYGDVDANGKRTNSSYINIILAQLIQPFLSKIIVKSKNLEKYIFLKSKCVILPNGVNLDKFTILDYSKTREELGLSNKKKYILFLGDKDKPRKNFKLLEEAYELISKEDVEILSPYPVSHDMVVKYLNAADLLAFPSYLEGSPNLVKEAMSCNLPILTVDVGDTTWLVSNVKKAVVVDGSPHSFAEKAQNLLKDSERSTGRNRIKELQIDSKSISSRLFNIYKEIYESK